MSSVFVLQTQQWGSVECVCVTDAVVGTCPVCLCYRLSVGEVLSVFVLQTQRWGSVEWHHDIDVFQSRARLSAATLLVHTTSEDVRTVFNKQAINSPV